MAFSFGQIVKLSFWNPRVLAKQLAATGLVALLFLTPFTPLAPVMITPASASNLSNCLHSLGAAEVLLGTLESDLPGITECAGQIAGGDLIMAAIAVILAADAAINGGFHAGTGSQIDQCDNMVNETIAELIVGGLKELYDAGSAGQTVVDTLFFGDKNAQKVFAYLSSASGSADLVGDLQDIPGFSELMSEITCGCTIVGGAMDIGSAAVTATEDSIACGKVVAGFFIGVGNAIASVGNDFGEYINCYGGCPTPGVDSTQTNDANQATGPVDCLPGLNQFGYLTVISTDSRGSTKTTTKYSCDCPADTTVQYQGSDTFDNANALSCVCNDHTLGYNVHRDGNSEIGTCGACPSAPGQGIAPTGECASFSCPQIPGMVATPETPGAEASGWGNCNYHHLCADGSVLNVSTASCDACGANQEAQYGSDPYGHYTGSYGESNYSGTSLSTGQCVDCPSGTASVVGSSSCAPLNCSLTQRVGDDGHTCAACDHVGRVLDAEVCVDDQGKALYAPQQCAWGTALPIERGNTGATSPVAYNPADCRPLDCKGTDHPDDGGNQCKHCDAVVNLPVSFFGGNAGGAKTASMPDGSKTINLPGGKSLSLGSIQSKGGTKSVNVTDTAGKIQVVNVGGASKQKTVAICMDPDNNPADRKPPSKLPGPVIYQQPPNLHPTESDLRPGVAVPFGGDPGNYPIINGGGNATEMPAKLPSGPGNRPRPPGGTSSSLPARGDPAGGQSFGLPAHESGGAATPLPAQGDPTGRKPGDSGGTSSALPGEGGGKAGPIEVGPARTRNGNEPGAHTTETMPAEGNRPLGTGPERSSKDKGNSGFTTEIMQGQGNAPVNAGPERSSKGKASGFTTFTMPGEGDGTSPKTSPQLHATPKMNEGPQLRTTPSLNGTQQLRLTPQLNTPQGARTPSLPNNAQQPERTRPTLNDSSSSGPMLTPGGRGPSSNPFGR